MHTASYPRHLYNTQHSKPKANQVLQIWKKITNLTECDSLHYHTKILSVCSYNDREI